jgi:hypothetical protein
MSEEKKKRKYEKRSSWWDYFEEIVKGQEAECKIECCKHKKVTFVGSTSSLRRHMESYHNDVIEKSGKSKKNLSKPFTKSERKEISKHTVLMMIMENRPFNMVQGEWYKPMMSKIQENWTPTDHKTFELYINEIYEEIYTKEETEKMWEKCLDITSCIFLPDSAL